MEVSNVSVSEGEALKGCADIGRVGMLSEEIFKPLQALHAWLIVLIAITQLFEALVYG